jgi:hypothetical protein
MTLTRKPISFALLVVAVCALALAGCGSDSEEGTPDAGAPGATPAASKPTEAKGVQPPPVQLLSGNFTGVKVDKPTVYVLHKQTELTSLLARHADGKGVASSSLSAGDYNTRQTVAVFLPQTTPGTSLFVDNVSPKDGKIVVKAVVVKPGKGCKIKGKKARPFAIVDTGRMTEKSTKLILSSQPNTPC